MLNLILKDLLVQKKSFIFTVFYSTFVFFAFSTPVFEQTIYAMGTIAIAYILILTATALDDKNRSEIILNSLPVKRDSIIMAKYLSIFVYIVVGIATMMVVGLALKLLGMPINYRLVNGAELVAILMSIGILCSIYFPIYYKFGSANVRIFNIFLFLALFFGPVNIANYMKKNGNNEFITSVLETIRNIPEWMIMSGVVAIVLAIILVSMLITIRIYRKKEF